MHLGNGKAEKEVDMTNQDTLYWIWLSEKCGVDSKQFGKLIEKIESPFDIYRLEDSEIEQIEGISNSLKAGLCQKNLDASYNILKYCNKNRVDIISYGDSRYPQRLKDLEAPPILLYCKGKLPDFNSEPRLCIGIVGTRKMSEYGQQSAYKISYELASAGVCTVSGMALGIDAISECATLAAGGTAVAVLGCGIDTVYPKQHKKLMEAIAENGAVITEYPPKEPPHGYNFPKRNRIISGLSNGVFIVEASVGSGALITARSAIAQGREVFALPGKISDQNSEGPNVLIKDGAHTALDAWDILCEYEFLYGDTIKHEALGKNKNVLENMDKMLRKYGLDYAVAKSNEQRPLEQRADVEKRKNTDTEKKIPQDKKTKDNSEAVLALLDETTRQVFELLPIDKPISCEELSQSGKGISEIVTALTMLEIQGLAEALPGGLYIRK